jgi:hypothetical protein
VLEVGKAGSAGAGKGQLPLLVDGVAVATLHSAAWKEAATAVVGDREWVFRKSGRELTGRWAADPEKAVRLRARQTSLWKSTWELDLEGSAAQLRPASRWKGTFDVSVDGRPVGQLGTAGGWAMRPRLTGADDLPLDQQVFLVWLQLLFQRRSTAVAAAGAA